MTKVVLWATGQMSQTLEYYLTQIGSYEIAGYTMDREYVKETSFNGKPVVPFDEVEKNFPPLEYKIAILISYSHLNKLREARYKTAKEKGYSFISYVHSQSVCDAAEIGENTFIFGNNDIQPYTKIGNNVVIWSNNGVGHHSVIEDNCFLASTKVSGHTVIGHNSFLGTGSSLADNVKVGAYCVIGTGAVVTKNVPDGTVLITKQTPAVAVKSWDMEDVLG